MFLLNFENFKMIIYIILIQNFASERKSDLKQQHTFVRLRKRFMVLGFMVKTLLRVIEHSLE